MAGYERTGKERVVVSGGRVSQQAFFDQACELAGTSNPLVVIDRSASTKPEHFDAGDQVADYLKRLGVRFMQLQDKFDQPPTAEQARERVEQADVLCVGGGSTERLLATWQKLGLTEHILERVSDGSMVASGASAGALVWFEWAHTDSEQYKVKNHENWKYTKIRGTAVLPGWATVHYSDLDSLGRSRSLSFRNSLRNGDGLWRTATGLDSQAAIVSVEGIAHAMGLADDGMNQRVYSFHAANRDLPRIVLPGERVHSLSPTV